MTDFVGNAAISQPLPNVASLRGTKQYVQWLVCQPGSGACNGYDLSNSWEIVIP
jgi:hypothetical protein